VGDNGLLLYTDNKGDTWQKLKLPTEVNLNNIFFLEKLGWIVGDNGIILRTENQGETWDLILNNTIQNLNDVFFLHKTIGWIVGDNGLLLHSVDSGLSWREEYSKTKNNLRGIDFLNEQLGYFVGFKGTILKYKRGEKPQIENPVYTTSIKNIVVREDHSPLLISLLDREGEKLFTPVDKVLNKGDYQFGLRSLVDDIPDGIYYMHIRIADISEIQKIFVIR
jgi:hypothetical protein